MDFSDKGIKQSDKRRMRGIWWAWAGALLLFLLNCCAPDTVPIISDTAFFPLKKGNYWIYEIEEHHYQEQSEISYSSYELKEEVVDSFFNVSSTLTYVIDRSVRTADDQPWNALDTWTVRVDNDRIIVTEGNKSYVKLALPLFTGRVWDGNALNADGQDDYLVSDMPDHVLSFDDGVDILQEDEENLLLKEKRMEVYARDVGMVYREKVEISYCADAGCIGQNIIEEGTEYYQVLTEYGD